MKKVLCMMLALCLLATTPIYAVATEENQSATNKAVTEETTQSGSSASSEATEQTPMFAWFDDDSKAATYNKFYPWAVENDIPFTSAVITGKIGVRGYLTADNLAEMYESGYVRYANHTVGHCVLTSVDSEEMESQIADAKAWLEEQGLPCDAMVYPGGKSNEEIINTTAKYYHLGFAAGGAATDTCRVNYADTSDVYKLKRLSISSASDMDYIKSQIDLCCSTGGVLFFMSHVGSTNGATVGASADADIAFYQEVVDYIREKGYDISSVKDACERFVEDKHVYDNDGDADCNICGETRVIADAALKFAQSPSLSFQEYIGMQISVRKSLAKNYDRVYVEATQMDPEKGAVVTELEPIPVGTSFYVFDQQIMAWSMTEQVTLTLYAEKDGVTYVGQTYTQSVETLALAMMEKYATNETICRMLVDMLNYGAAVQSQFGYNASVLPNTNLGAFADKGTTEIPVCNADKNITGTATVKVINDSISMQAKVEIQLLIKGAVTHTPKATIGTTELAPWLDTTSIQGYTVVRVAIGATQLRENVTIALYDADGNPVTKVYNVSVEAYAETAINGSQKDVVIAMMRYGDSVTAYANK